MHLTARPYYGVDGTGRQAFDAPDALGFVDDGDEGRPFHTVVRVEG